MNLEIEVLNTVKEMFKARNWTLTTTPQQKQSVNSNPHAIWAITENGKLAVAEFIETASEIKTSPFQILIDDKHEEFECITIVCETGITTNIKKIEQISKNKVELFKMNDLKINITKHVLQPHFQKLKKEEGVLFKKKYTGFSTLLKTDPVSKFLRFQPGDVIRIVPRDNDTIDEISYKIVK